MKVNNIGEYVMKYGSPENPGQAGEFRPEAWKRRKKLIWLQIILTIILFGIIFYFSQHPPKTGYIYMPYGRHIENQIRPLVDD